MAQCRRRRNQAVLVIHGPNWQIIRLATEIDQRRFHRPLFALLADGQSQCGHCWVSVARPRHLDYDRRNWVRVPFWPDPFRPFPHSGTGRKTTVPTCVNRVRPVTLCRPREVPPGHEVAGFWVWDVLWPSWRAGRCSLRDGERRRTPIPPNLPQSSLSRFPPDLLRVSFHFAIRGMPDHRSVPSATASGSTTASGRPTFAPAGNRSTGKCRLVLPNRGKSIRHGLPTSSSK